VRVKLDENLPDSVLSILGRAGHDVDTARAEGLRGAKDPAVLAGATADGRLLLTLDRGLGDIRAYPPGSHAGVLVIRLDHQSPRAIRHAVERIGAAIDLDNLHGCVAVWRDGELRVRRPSA
jgi:predicted nuclease of predicted toxin-antitoxin system